MVLNSWLGNTMLLERTVGILSYVVGVAFAAYLLRIAETQEERKRSLRFLLVYLCILAFFYIPAETSDLYSWRELAKHYWQQYSLFSFIKGPVIQSPTPVAYLVIYLCFISGIPGILPMLCAFIFYRCVFSIFLDAIERFEISSLVASMVLVFFMASGCFLEVISGVRCFVALSVVAWCIYTELTLQRSVIRNLPLYALAFLVHSSAVSVIVIQIVYHLFEILYRKRVNVWSFFVTGAVCAVGLYLGRNYVFAAIEKGNSYFTNEVAYQYYWEYIIGILELTVIGVMLFIYWRMDASERASMGIERLAVYNTMFSLINLVIIFEYNSFHRFLLMNLIMSLPLCCCVLQACLRALEGRMIKMFQLMNLAVFALACVRGNLCGYKFFLI